MIASDTEGEPCRRVIFCAKHRTQDILLSEYCQGGTTRHKEGRSCRGTRGSQLSLLAVLLLCDVGITKKTIPTKLYREDGHLSRHAPTSCDRQEAQQQQHHQQHPPTRWLTVAARCTLSTSNHTAVTRRRTSYIYMIQQQKNAAVNQNGDWHGTGHTSQRRCKYKTKVLPLVTTTQVWRCVRTYIRRTRQCARTYYRS